MSRSTTPGPPYVLEDPVHDAEHVLREYGKAMLRNATLAALLEQTLQERDDLAQQLADTHVALAAAHAELHGVTLDPKEKQTA